MYDWYPFFRKNFLSHSTPTTARYVLQFFRVCDLSFYLNNFALSTNFEAEHIVAVLQVMLINVVAMDMLKSKIPPGDQ